MNKLRDRLLARLAFDERYANIVAKDCYMRSKEHFRKDGTIRSTLDRMMRSCFFAMKDEHARNRALILKMVECVEALQKIGKVDHPSVADKTSWIVMTESICVLARETLAALEAELGETK